MSKPTSTFSSAERKILNLIARADRSRKHTNVVKELNRQAKRGILPQEEEVPVVEEEVEVDEEELDELESSSEEVDDVVLNDSNEPPTDTEPHSDIIEPIAKKAKVTPVHRFPRLVTPQLRIEASTVDGEFILPPNTTHFVPDPRRWIACDRCDWLIRSDQVLHTTVGQVSEYYHVECLQELMDSKHR